MKATDQELPPGIRAIHPLPQPELRRLWDSIILDESLKNQLLGQALFSIHQREKIDRTILPLHGTILLVGSPGTGKTSLARGLADRVAETSSTANIRLVEVEPHSLTNSFMGKTQKAVVQLFSVAIREQAFVGPTIVLLDEIETLAVDRSQLSLEANPVDIHRATDAVLVELDSLAEEHSNLLFIATSNFPKAVDAAFTSRCDLVLEIPLPGSMARRQILQDCLEGLAKTFAKLGHLATPSHLDNFAAASEGLDGRALRKAVASAIGSSPKTALDPSLITADTLLEALQSAKHNRTEGTLAK